MICAPITAKTNEEMLALIPAAAFNNAVDIIELRVDGMSEAPDFAKMLAASHLPCIVTCRTKHEGGEFEGSDGELRNILQSAIDAGADYVDVEIARGIELARSDKTKIIGSYHDFEKMPTDLHAIVEKILASDCDVVKFAVMPEKLSDNLKVFEEIKFVKESAKDCIGIAMGELGTPSRILGVSRGAMLTFGSVEAGKESAPGQLTAHDLKYLYRVNEINDATKIYGVVGNPIAHSMSPEIHNKAFIEMDINAVYLRLRVENFDEFMKDFAEPLGIEGLSVTIPHKDAALKYAGGVDTLAEKIGAVNTLSKTPDGWAGTNTDCAAAIGSIKIGAKKSGTDMQGATAMILGAGGTAKALAYGLKQEGCEVIIANRTFSKAEALAEQTGAKAIKLEDACEQKCDIIANTTSVGMYPNVDACPINISAINKGMVVFDAIYNPQETMLLKYAKEYGAEVATGLDMFVEQAALQFEIWNEGVEAPRDVMREVVIRRLSE